MILIVFNGISFYCEGNGFSSAYAMSSVVLNHTFFNSGRSAGTKRRHTAYGIVFHCGLF